MEIALLSDATSWGISLVTVLTAAVVEVGHVEVVEGLTCVATTAMKLDTCLATVQLWPRRDDVVPADHH